MDCVPSILALTLGSLVPAVLTQIGTGSMELPFLIVSQMLFVMPFTPNHPPLPCPQPDQYEQPPELAYQQPPSSFDQCTW